MHAFLISVEAALHAFVVIRAVDHGQTKDRAGQGSIGEHGFFDVDLFVIVGIDLSDGRNRKAAAVWITAVTEQGRFLEWRWLNGPGLFAVKNIICKVDIAAAQHDGAERDAAKVSRSSWAWLRVPAITSTTTSG